ncbi:hypothetical protein [Klebsiella pneumoniae]|uniref:hypothetical protein n=1 Tax=Klebsiella pneumoniae TaxID=573 RepID=UPI001F5556C3|nr:hypothetical protein [Klebsiella pneumoniae]
MSFIVDRNAYKTALLFFSQWTRNHSRTLSAQSLWEVTLNTDRTNLIETRRRHLVRAKLDSMMRRTGSYFQIVELEDGTTLPVELDEDILTKALIKLFEAMIYDNHKREQAEHLIAEHYSNCMGVNKLTPDGVDFMNALIATLAEQSLKAEESTNG